MAYARDMNSGGGIVIACEIILFQPCPVDSEKKHKGQPITELSDAHVVVVKHADDLQKVSTIPMTNSSAWNKSGGVRVSTEIVISDSSHALPRFILKF
eukprot:m.71949 g.71949  ORF g.71949 m.71949 type:complete len:98 (+) comp12292_c1_seq1:668-961(+)